MKVCVAYRGLSYMDSFKNHHGTCTFSMLDVIDNHVEMLVEPLEKLGHEVVYSISTNESPVLKDIVDKLGHERCVYVSTVGCDQMDRGSSVIKYLPPDVTHVFMTRCDVRFKCSISELRIDWDVMNFPWVNFDRNFPRNGDVFLAFPRELFGHVSDAFHQLHVYFKKRNEIPHGHGLYKRFFKNTKYNCAVSDYFNSNTDVTQNPVFVLARSFGADVPLHPRMLRGIELLRKYKTKRN